MRVSEVDHRWLCVPIGIIYCDVTIICITPEGKEDSLAGAEHDGRDAESCGDLRYSSGSWVGVALDLTSAGVLPPGETLRRNATPADLETRASPPCWWLVSGHLDGLQLQGGTAGVRRFPVTGDRVPSPADPSENFGSPSNKPRITL